MGIIIGVCLVEFNIMPEMLDLFVDSGGVDKSIEVLSPKIMNNLNYVTVGVLGSVLTLGACSINLDATQMLNTSSVEYKNKRR